MQTVTAEQMNASVHEIIKTNGRRIAVTNRTEEGCATVWKWSPVVHPLVLVPGLGWIKGDSGAWMRVN